jgi:hypothetical protein
VFPLPVPPVAPLRSVHRGLLRFRPAVWWNLLKYQKHKTHSNFPGIKSLKGAGRFSEKTPENAIRENQMVSMKWNKPDIPDLRKSVILRFVGNSQGLFGIYS